MAEPTYEELAVQLKALTSEAEEWGIDSQHSKQILSSRQLVNRVKYIPTCTNCEYCMEDPEEDGGILCTWVVAHRANTPFWMSYIGTPVHSSDAVDCKGYVYIDRGNE